MIATFGSAVRAVDRALTALGIGNGAIDDECIRQIAKWGEQAHHPDDWFAIAGEEVGEVAKELVERNAADAQIEIVQLYAALERGFGDGR